jgi:repressor LexA
MSDRRAVICARPETIHSCVRSLNPMKSILAQRIQAAREAMFPAVNQKDIAAKLGKSPSAVSLWESGKNEPRPAEIVALAKTFGVSVGWLMGADETNNTVQASSSQGTPVVSIDALKTWDLQAPEEYVYTSRDYPVGTAVGFKNNSSALPSVAPMGAICIVSRAHPPTNGTPVVAMVDGDLLLRRIVQDGGQTLLLSDDPRFASVPLDKATVIGRIVEVIQRTTL